MFIKHKCFVNQIEIKHDFYVNFSNFILSHLMPWYMCLSVSGYRFIKVGKNGEKWKKNEKMQNLGKMAGQGARTQFLAARALSRTQQQGAHAQARTREEWPRTRVGMHSAPRHTRSWPHTRAMAAHAVGRARSIWCVRGQVNSGEIMGQVIMHDLEPTNLLS